MVTDYFFIYSYFFQCEEKNEKKIWDMEIIGNRRKNKFFFFEKILSIFDVENWLRKYNFGTFLQTIIHCRIVLKQLSLSMSVLGQEYCILKPTIFKILQPNLHYEVIIHVLF